MHKLLIRIIVTTVLLGWLFAQVDISGVGSVFAQTRPGWLALAAVINLLSVGLMVWRWQLLLAGMGVVRSFWNLLHITLVSTFFSMFLPSSIGGDVMKMVLVAPDPAQREAAVASVLIDRVVGMAVTIAVGLLGVLWLPAVWGNHALIGALVAATLAFCLGVTMLFSRVWFLLLTRLVPGFLWRRFGTAITEAHRSIIRLRRRPAVLLSAAAISGARQVMVCFSVLFAGYAFSISVSPIAYFAIVPIVLAITVLPFAIGGLGLQDNAMVLLFGAVGVSAVQALSLSIFLHVMRNLVGIIGGILFAAGQRRSADRLPRTNGEGGDSTCEGDNLQPVR